VRVWTATPLLSIDEICSSEPPFTLSVYPHQWRHLPILTERKKFCSMDRRSIGGEDRRDIAKCIAKIIRDSAFPLLKESSVNSPAVVS
jgi:hypothetical protein